MVIYKNKEKYLAFTLAEVLITLLVIGGVAAITITILVNSYQKTQYATSLRKIYSQFNHVLSQFASDNGCPGDLKCTGFFDSGSNALTIGGALVKYFKVAKDCGVNQNLGCMPSTVNNNFDGSGTTTNMDSGAWGTGPHYRFITLDGVGVDIVFDGSCLSCSQDKSANYTGNLKQTCTWVKFDINGPAKGPNYSGRDIFIFWISNGKGPLLYPQGGQDDANSGWWKDGSGGCGNMNNGGYKCAARIMEEGWQMNY